VRLKKRFQQAGVAGSGYPRRSSWQLALLLLTWSQD